MKLYVVCVMFGFLSLVLPLAAQTVGSNAPVAAVPPVIQFSNLATDEAGNPMSGSVAITFSLYNNARGGEPLWSETQKVQLDSAGRYSVYVGITKANGVPVSFFTAGQAHWLGVQIAGQTEQPRVFLVSVPYALKAGDAATVGGLPPSAFMLAAPGATTVAVAGSSSSSQSAGPNVGGSGTENYIPLWTNNSGTLGDSAFYQVGSGSSILVGLNLKSPLATLDVNGTELVRGLFELATTNFAKPTKGYNSQPFNFESSSYNSGTAKYTLNHFQWQAEPTGNNTTNPSATLNLLFGTEPNQPAETGLKLSSTGVFTFASGQTFPGTGPGTITGVTAGTDLKGGGISGNVTLNLDTTKVPQLKTANAFTGNQTVTGNLSATNEVSAGSTQTGNVASGTVEVDAAAINNGSWSPALSFGGGGEVIASNRAGSTNQFGLDLFTSYTPRLSVTNTGLVGIGVQSPGWMLEVDPPNDSRIFGSAIFGANDTGSGVGASYALYAAGGYDITNVSFNSAGLGGFLIGGSSNIGFGGDGLDAWAGTGPLANGYAGFFSGDVYVSGNLSKNGGSFKIDHPLDPANEYLYHSFVESPDMMDIYNGNVTLDDNGEAVVALPEWFGALNRDYRYQLTCIGGFAPVYIAQEISNNQFQIGGGKSGMKVSWQVTGVRQDAWANAHRIPVEEQKSGHERGYYLHPELYGAPEEKGIAWARHPEIMRLTKARQAKLTAQSTHR